MIRVRIQRFALVLAAAALVIGFTAGRASATASTTCHHGASQKDCRPDPQPTHGKDCSHPSKGNPAGINQDHCEGSPSSTSTTTTIPSTTTRPTITTTSAPSPATSTTTSPAPGSTVGGTPSSSQPPVAEHCTDASGLPYETSPSTGCLQLAGAPTPTSAPVTPGGTRPAELPHTGAATDVLIFVGFFCLGFGLTSLFLSRKH